MLNLHTSKLAKNLGINLDIRIAHTLIQLTLAVLFQQYYLYRKKLHYKLEFESLPSM